MTPALSKTSAVTTQAAPSSRPATTPTSEIRIVLEGVSWETFNRLLAEMGADRHQRLAYRDGMLEIMVPLQSHEEPTRLLDQFLAAMIDELELDFRSLGSLTMKNAKQKKGLEPDCCFYIKHETVVRGVETLDFDIHPPPDLVVEVDNSNSSLSKFPIYVALKIPEIWRLRLGKLTIYHLDAQASEYEQKDQSLAFPQLPVQELPQLIERAKEIGQRAAVRELVQRVRQVLAGLEPHSTLAQ